MGALAHRIGAHTVGDLDELRQVLLDLLGRHARCGVERRLVAAKRGVGDAQEFGVRIDRRVQQRDRRGKPPPHGRNRNQGHDEKRQWRTKGNQLPPPSRPRRLAPRPPSAKWRGLKGFYLDPIKL